MKTIPIIDNRDPVGEQDMADCLIFLQNAWSPVYAGQEWPRKSWLLALSRSRSGKRLNELLRPLKGAGITWEIYNTTPICGRTSNSVVKPAFGYMSGCVLLVQPKMIIACGRQAHDAVEALKYKHATRWVTPIWKLPHPSYRLLYNGTYHRAALMIRATLGAAQERE